VGVSLQYGQWHHLYQLLTDGLPLEEALKLVFHSFDISAMEATIRIPVFIEIYKMRFSNLVIPPNLLFYYTNLHNWFVSVLFYAFVIDPHGYLIIMFGGNPSGGFNTLTDNGFAQMLYKNYSLAKHSTDYTQLRNYVNKLRIKMVGDDCIEQEHPLIKYYIEDCKDLGVDVKYECEPGSIITQKFLNIKWVISPTYGMMIPGANLDKMLSNVFHHRKRNSWRLTYVKLQAIRFFSQVYPELDYQIKFYIKYIETHHMEDMKQEKLDDVLTMQATLSQSLSEDQLNFMMYGLNAESYIQDSPQLFYIENFRLLV
jgi:3-hydroxymyristoyl/3-hydroxydecanoyl-(acyl carrier protein) dehydratase